LFTFSTRCLQDSAAGDAEAVLTCEIALLGQHVVVLALFVHLLNNVPAGQLSTMAFAAR
jgi:hypothetical protein